MDFKAYRKAQKIRIKQTGLNTRTVNKIESGNEDVTIKSFKQYLEAINVKLIYTV